MSSIRSASSRTNVSTVRSCTSPCDIRSRRRPGVATRMSIPRRRACDCGPWLTPPKTMACLRAVCLPYAPKLSAIWEASSRVGVSTRTRMGRRPVPFQGVPLEAVQDREREGGRLPGAGLRAADQVLPLEHDGDRLLLDGGRDGVLLLRDGAEDLGAEPERFKRHLLFQQRFCLHLLSSPDVFFTKHNRWAGQCARPIFRMVKSREKLDGPAGVPGCSFERTLGGEDCVWDI